MSKTVALAIAAGIAGAAFWLSLPFSAPLPLFLVGFGLGVPAILAAGAALLVSVALVGGPLAALNAGSALVLPVVVLVRQALLARPQDDGSLEWYPTGSLVVWLTGLGAGLVILGVIVAGARSPDGAEAWVREVLEYAIRELGLIAGDAQLGFVVDILAPVAPGVAVATWLVLLVLNGAAAQAFLVRSGKNLRPRADLAMFRLPGWMPVPLAILGITSLVVGGDLGFAARNLMLVGLVPYFLMGVAVVHVVSRAWPGRTIILLLFYTFLFFFGWPMSLLLMMLGLAEHWLNWRARRNGPPGEI